MEVCSYCCFQWCGYFQVPRVSFVMTDEFSVRVTKITLTIDVSWIHSLRFWFWPIFKSVKWPYYQKSVKPDNFESHDSQKRNFTKVQGLHLNFAECESFLESNSPDILDLCGANLDDSRIQFNFSKVIADFS